MTARCRRYMLISRQQWDEFGSGQRDLYDEEWERLQKGQKLIGETPHVLKLLQLRQVSRAIIEARPTNLHPFPSTEWLSFTSTRQRIVDGQQHAESRQLFPAATLQVDGVRGNENASDGCVGAAMLFAEQGDTKECHFEDGFSAESADVDAEQHGEDRVACAGDLPGCENESAAGTVGFGGTWEGEVDWIELAKPAAEDEEEILVEVEDEEVIGLMEAPGALTLESLDAEGKHAVLEGDGPDEGAEKKPVHDEERRFLDEKSSQSNREDDAATRYVQFSGMALYHFVPFE